MLNFDDEVTTTAAPVAARMPAMGMSSNAADHSYTIASTSTGRIRVEDKSIINRNNTSSYKISQNSVQRYHSLF